VSNCQDTLSWITTEYLVVSRAKELSCLHLCPGCAYGVEEVRWQRDPRITTDKRPSCQPNRRKSALFLDSCPLSALAFDPWRNRVVAVPLRLCLVSDTFEYNVGRGRIVKNLANPVTSFLAPFWAQLFSRETRSQAESRSAANFLIGSPS
jgi:hypothetical protein